MGLPEGVLPMTQAAIYLALAPKSNAAIAAYGNARAARARARRAAGAAEAPQRADRAHEGARLRRRLPVPARLRGHYVAEEYLPDALRGEEIVKLSESGLEKALGERWREIKAKLGK